MQAGPLLLLPPPPLRCPCPPTCIAQKARKQPPWAQVMPRAAMVALPTSVPPVSVCSIWWMAAPPSQVLSPNQPAATRPRSRAGSTAPNTPNELRASTGKGACRAEGEGMDPGDAIDGNVTGNASGFDWLM
jgi:hypothetical protein